MGAAGDGGGAGETIRAIHAVMPPSPQPGSDSDADDEEMEEEEVEEEVEEEEEEKEEEKQLVEGEQTEEEVEEEVEEEEEEIEEEKEPAEEEQTEEEVEEEVEEEEEETEEEQWEIQEQIEQAEEEVEGVSGGGAEEEGVEGGKVDDAKGVRNSGICPVYDRSDEMPAGHDNVSTISYVNSKALTSDKQADPSEGEFPMPLVARKDTSTPPEEGAHPLGSGDNGIDKSTNMSFDGKESGVKTVDNNISHCNSDILPHLEKGALNLHKVVGTPAMEAKTRAIRSRSPSADAVLETSSKRPAIACNFFAKGWCIKGSSCKFLHLKDGAEDIAGQNKAIPKTSTPELLSSQAAKNVKTDTGFLLQRELIRRYGNDKLGEEYPGIEVNNHHQVLSMNENSNSIYGPSFEQHAAYGNLASGLTERKLYNEVLQSDHLDNGVSSKNRFLMGGSLVPNHSFCSSSSSIGPAVHDPASSEKSAANKSLIGQWNLSEMRTSHKVADASIPTGVSSFQENASSIRKFPQQANSYAHEYGCSINGMINFDGGYSQCHTSSPKYSKDAPVSLSHKTQSQNAWVPSIPFRSYFNCSSAAGSSPGSQYDPLLDSIEPSRVDRENTSGLNLGLSLSKRSLSPAYNIHMDTIRESKTNFSYGMRGYISTDSGTGLVGGVNNGRMSSEEKSYSPYTVGSECLKNAEKLIQNQDDGERQMKEPKMLKLFRAQLVEFVKDLLKPFWREGHLSKDAHKMIVKKAEEKVLGSLQSHRIPSNLESTNQYFSSFRPKLEKLVEGYVEKYKS